MIKLTNILQEIEIKDNTIFIGKKIIVKGAINIYKGIVTNITKEENREDDIIEIQWEDLPRNIYNRKTVERWLKTGKTK